MMYSFSFDTPLFCKTVIEHFMTHLPIFLSFALKQASNIEPLEMHFLVHSQDTPHHQ